MSLNVSTFPVVPQTRAMIALRCQPTPAISLETRILDLPDRGFPRLGPLTARKLALGVAGTSTGKDINNATVEDLLHYLPMRYEDRSNLARLRDLQ